MNTIAALRNGDISVFQQVFSEYHAKLYSYIYSKTRSSYIAEEVVQLTFIKIWDLRNSLHEDIAISRQIFRIAKTTLIDVLRKQKNSSRVHNEAFKRVPLLYSSEIDERMDAMELSERIRLEVWRMPAVRRKVFEMSRFSGMSYKEISVALSVSIKTVENHISRAIKQLQHLISLIILLLMLF